MKREERLAYIALPYVVGSLRCCARSLLLWGFAIDGSSDRCVMDTPVVLCFIIVGSLHRRSVLARFSCRKVPVWAAFVVDSPRHEH